MPFDRELSIVAVRGARRRDPVLARRRERPPRRHPARLPRAGARTPHRRAAEAIATALLDELDYVGVLAVELFEVDGRLLANEFAPRVHNTGHWTIDGAVTSQFENHLRAILGLPLGETDALAPAVMVNLIGGIPPLDELLALPARAPPSLRQGAATRAQGRPRDARRGQRRRGLGGDRARGGRRDVGRARRPAVTRDHRGRRTAPSLASSLCLPAVAVAPASPPLPGRTPGSDCPGRVSHNFVPIAPQARGAERAPAGRSAGRARRPRPVATPPGVRVRLEVRLASTSVGDVRVPLGGGEIGVAEHLLDASAGRRRPRAGASRTSGGGGAGGRGRARARRDRRAAAG